MDTSATSSPVEFEASPARAISPTRHEDDVESGSTVEVQREELAEFARWHAGWSLVELRPGRDPRLVLPLLLHDLLWESSQCAVLVRAIQGVSPTSMVLLTLRVEEVREVRIGTSCRRLERCIYVRTKQGRLVTMRLRLNLGRRADYLEAWRLMQMDMGPGPEREDPAIMSQEAGDLAITSGRTAGCSPESAQPTAS